MKKGKRGKRVKRIVSFILTICIAFSTVFGTGMTASAGGGVSPGKKPPNAWVSGGKSFVVNKVYSTGLLVCGTALVKIAGATDCEEFQKVASFINKWVCGGGQGQTLGEIKALCTEILNEVKVIEKELTVYTSQIEKMLGEDRCKELLSELDKQWKSDVLNIENNYNIKSTLNSYRNYMNKADEYSKSECTMDDVNKAKDDLFDEFCNIYKSKNTHISIEDNTYEKLREMIFSDTSVYDCIRESIDTMSGNLLNDTNYADISAQFAYNALPFASDQHDYILASINKQFTEIIMLEMMCQEYLAQFGDYLEDKYPENKDKWDGYDRIVDSFGKLNKKVAETMESMLDRKLQVNPMHNISLKISEYPSSEDAAKITLHNKDYKEEWEFKKSDYSLHNGYEEDVTTRANYIKENQPFERIFTLTDNGIKSFFIASGSEEEMKIINMDYRKDIPHAPDQHTPSADYMNLTKGTYGDGVNNNYKCPSENFIGLKDDLFNTNAYLLCDSTPAKYLSQYYSYAGNNPVYLLTGKYKLDTRNGIKTGYEIFYTLETFQKHLVDDELDNFKTIELKGGDIQNGESKNNSCYSVILENKDDSFMQKTDVRVEGTGKAEIFIDNDGDKDNVTLPPGSEIKLKFKADSEDTILNSLTVQRHINASNESDMSDKTEILKREQIESLETDDKGYYIFSYNAPYSNITISLNAEKGNYVYFEDRNNVCCGDEDKLNAILLDSYTNIYLKDETVNFFVSDIVEDVVLKYNNKSESVRFYESEDSGRMGNFVMPDTDVIMDVSLKPCHNYTDNGFCSRCGAYQKAELKNNIYEVSNGGQLFWFASLVNGDNALAEFDKKDESAKCVIKADIDLEGREWKPISNFKGTFDGQNHTISGLKITDAIYYAGLFENTLGAAIKDFSIKGDINLEAPNIHIGGIVGYADGGMVSNISSYINISTKGKGNFVGGIIGEVGNDVTNVEKCVYYGCIKQQSNPASYIGGVTGYTGSGGRISNCANLGVVSASEKGAYVGGISGSMNHSGLSIKNCYNYGEVSNAGDKTKCGALIGYLGSYISVSDNYYLNSPESIPYGSDCYAGHTLPYVGAVSKTDAQFASGEVAYLLNNSRTDGKQAWYQNIGEDNVPVLDGNRKTVYKVNMQLCPDCKKAGYSNINEDTICGEHNFVDGVCTYCGKKADHIYDKEGFCTVCGGYQKAELKNNIYEISNAGQLFWFASLVNGDTALAEFDKQDMRAKCTIMAEIDLKGREWKPIYGFKGTFDGQNHVISGLKVTKPPTHAGFFGNVSGGAVIKDFSLKGDIILPEFKKYYVSSGAYAGGVIGCADGATVSNISSYINITLTGKDLVQVGGIIGGICSNETNVEKCVYYGKIELSNPMAYIGGIAGYADRGGHISNCANLGTVSASQKCKYMGGILGYMYSPVSTVKNCYNYGTVSNAGDKSGCGVVIGGAENFDSGNISNNYFLDSSSSLAYGSDSISGLEAFAKTNAQFTSGEVAYLLNDGETGGKQAWYQTIGKDNVPVLDSNHKTVYKINKQLCPGCKAEEEYSNTNGDICGKHNFVDGVCTYCGLEEKADAPFDKDENGNFIIKTYDDLVKLAEIVKSDYDIYGDKGYVLANNIIAGKDSVWRAGIGSVSENKPFNGTFNGNGYCIMGLNIDSPEYGGLFEIIGEKGKVQDLFVLKFKYASPCENAGSIAAVNNGTIDHCTNGINVGSAFIFTDPQTKEPIKAQEFNSEINGTLSGGIAANNAGLIRGCRNAAIITGTECGGIAGVNTGEIYGCANNGRIGIEGSSLTKTAGGITAKNGGTVASSYNSEKIYGKSGKTVGSIAGLNGFGTESSPIVKNVFYISVNGITAAGTDSLVKSVDSSNTSKKQSEMREDSFNDALNSVTDDTVRWCRAKSVNKGYPRIENKVFEQVEKKLENGITLKGSMHSSLNISYSLLDENSDEYNKLVSDINQADNKEIDDIPALTSYGSSLIDINGERKVVKGYSVSLTDSEKNPILAELWIQGDIEISVPVEHGEVTLAGVGSDGSLIECEPQSYENGAAVFKLSEPVSFVITDKSGEADSNVPDDNKTQVKTNTHKGGTIVKTGDLSNVLLWMFAIPVSSAAVIILWRRRKVG